MDRNPIGSKQQQFVPSTNRTIVLVAAWPVGLEMTSTRLPPRSDGDAVGVGKSGAYTDSMGPLAISAPVREPSLPTS